MGVLVDIEASGQLVKVLSPLGFPSTTLAATVKGNIPFDHTECLSRRRLETATCRAAEAGLGYWHVRIVLSDVLIGVFNMRNTE